MGSTGRSTRPRVGSPRSRKRLPLGVHDCVKVVEGVQNEWSKG